MYDMYMSNAYIHIYIHTYIHIHTYYGVLDVGGVSVAGGRRHAVADRAPLRTPLRTLLRKI